MSKKPLVLLFYSVLCGLWAGQANALPIQGSIDFNGVVTFNTTSLATATQVSIWNSSFVAQRTGDFIPFTNVFDNVTMAAPWVFNSGTPGTPMPGPSTPALWSVGGFTFDLTFSTVTLQNVNFLNVTGPGIASGNGFDSTPGKWSFSSSNPGGNPQTTFSFQSDTVVPEASTIGLFVIGSLGMVGMYCWRPKSRPAPILPS